MCGILAYISNEHIHNSKVKKIKQLMKSRGPNNQSYQKYLFGKKKIHFFHSRLSIQDLEKRSNQPFVYNDYVIIYNGEIYNFKSLKKKLSHKFRTHSDTELILHYYSIYKEKCFKYFEGMWSIIIYDKKKNKIIISRDRFGEKPLFFYRKNNEIIFASELRYINEILDTKLNFNHAKINRFLHYGYKSLFKDDETFFKEVKHFEKNKIAIIDKNLNFSLKSYWSIKDHKKKQNYSLKENINNTKDLLVRSVGLRMVADTPIALSLSGGIDSGAICSIASKVYGKKLESFSIIDSDIRYNESSSIDTTAKDCGIKNHKINISKSGDFLSILDKSIDQTHYPITTITDLILYQLTSKIKEYGYKVCLSGSGGDELFAGYYDHYLMFFSELRKRNSPKFKKFLKIWSKNIKPHIRNKFYLKHDLFFKNSNYRGYVYDNYEENKKFCLNQISYQFNEKKIFHNLLKNRMANELLHENVPIFTHREDLCYMNSSIENRLPFLDSNLIKYSFNNIQGSQFLENCQNKFILRESLKGILNEKVRNHKIKSGFNASIFTLFNFKEKKLLSFCKNKSEIYDFIDKEKILFLIQNPQKLNQNQNAKFMFTFLSLKMFMDKFNK